MAQEPVRVVVEKKGGCFSGCGTVIAVVFLIAIAIQFWYVSAGLVVVAVAAGLIIKSQNKQKAKLAAKRRQGPRDPWLNKIAVALSELGFNDIERNTGNQICGVSLEGDITVQDDLLLVYINLFADQDSASSAELGLRARAETRAAISNGHVVLKLVGPVLFMAKARKGLVDEFRVTEIARVIEKVPMPPAAKPEAAATAAPTAAGSPEADAQAPPRNDPPPSDPLEQIRVLGEMRDAGLLTDAEFQDKKADLLRRL